MDKNKIIEEYRDSIRRCDYWSQRSLTFDSMMLAFGLYMALCKKGIITREEYNLGISSAKELYKDKSRKLQANYDKAVADKDKLENELLEK